ncbi:MAG TPA: hypothetical protein VH092_00630 [Urbifossiella sp.]|jgi:hypothetical protein|nr:hypothetical protein [Urbifossiella sp.]
MSDAMQTWTRGRTEVVAAGWAWLAAVTYFKSDALCVDLFGPCLLIVAGFGIGVAWIWQSLLWVFRPWTWRGLLLWLTVPAAPVVAYDEDRTAWPLVARVWLCESALRAHAAAVQVEHKRGPGRVGLFAVKEASHYGDGVVAFTTVRGFFVYGGLLYVPGDMPSGWTHGEMQHLYGPWYRWVIQQSIAG